MSKVALIIIYNHQYNKNIEVLDKLYGDRFSNIFHLVPFYKGTKENVISVYENSYYFQGYVSQGLSSFFKDEYVHYFFIGDDLLLNPKINESNYTENLKLDKDTSFIPGFMSLHKLDFLWPHTKDALNYNLSIDGIEAKSMLPNYEEAILLFKKFNLEIDSLKFEQLFNRPLLRYNFKALKRFIAYHYKKRLNKEYNLSYPIVGSYSDIFVVSSNTIKDFCLYSGVFSATNMFVELAIPTAMVLSAKKIVTEKDLDLQGIALWSMEDYKILDKYNYNLNGLQNDFPEKYLYIHPIKLSKWK
ncbi:hypothetical protein [Polaribacter sp. KT 15]|uniref:hypothetical protein n=1 Tax=Polaribacter sp. KT 15 TaxID=1896175 RepID=UPI00090A1DEB|nr:hypothetical protein [Polaribacter sp. KT 15]SHN09787.1 hypothetical protein SAMN05720268_2891 [Polaribacter sp. KT 15]